MVAKFTLEFDDQTEPGFRNLVKNFESAAKGSNEFTGAAQGNNQALIVMQQQQTATVAAIQQNTLAIQQNRDSWIEVTNTMFEFGRNAGAVLGKVKNLTVGMTDQAVQLGIVESRGAAAALVAKSLALRMAGIAAPVAVATAGWKAYTGILKATGKEVKAVDQANQHLADSINSGHKTVQQVVDETGKSFDDLGLKVETNWDRVRQSTNKTASLIGSDLSSIASEAVKLTGIPAAASAIWEEVDAEATRFTDNYRKNLEIIEEGWDSLMGRSTELRREQEKLAEIAEREAPMRKRVRDFEAGIQRQAQLERELHDIARIENQKEIQNRLTSEREKREIAIREGKFRGDVEESTNARIKALIQQQESLRLEHLRKMKAANEKAAQEQERLRVEAHQKLIQQWQEEAKAREELLQKQQRIENAFREGSNSLVAQQKLQIIEMAKARQQMVEKEKINHQVILDLDKEAARVRAEEALASAETEEEVLRIRYQLTRELRDLDFQHKVETERRKIEAAEKAAKEEVEAENKKIDAIKALRNKQGQNAFESIAKSQSKDDVLKEITRRRLAKSREDDPDLSPARRRRKDIEIRRQTLQQARSGQINPGEIARVQGDLAAKQVLHLNKQGKLSKEVLTSLAEQAKTFGEHAKLQEELVQQNQEIQNYLRQQQNQARSRQQRTQSQRRGTRG